MTVDPGILLIVVCVMGVVAFARLVLLVRELWSDGIKETQFAKCTECGGLHAHAAVICPGCGMLLQPGHFVKKSAVLREDGFHDPGENGSPDQVAEYVRPR